MEINTIRYVFGSSKPELRRLLVKYGLPPAKNEQDLWRKTNYLVAKFKDEMLKDIAYIHPDRELIIWSMQNDNDTKSEVSEIEEKSNYCGCGCGTGKQPCGCGCGCDKKSNAEGQETVKPQPQQVGGQVADTPIVVVTEQKTGTFQETLKNNMPLVIVGSLLLVGGLIFMGNRKMS
jgi:hypothetical protein